MEPTKTKNQDLSAGIGLGKVPPQNKPVESAILGALLIEPKSIDRVLNLLTKETFYSSANQEIYAAITKLYASNRPVDLLTVIEELQKSEKLDLVGGPRYLANLTRDVVSGANIEAHARIIIEKHISRELIRISAEIINDAYSDKSDPFNVLQTAEEGLSAIRFGNSTANYKRLGDVIFKNLQQLDDLRAKGWDITGVSSGFPDLDKVTCGWQSTDLIILAARPSVGKTALALTLAKHAASVPDFKTPVGVFSLEMADRQLVNRILSQTSKVWMWKFKNGQFTDAEMQHVYKTGEDLSDVDIFIDDTSGIPIQVLKSKARQMVKRDKVGFIIIDYLQLITVPGVTNREQQISTISRELKGLAKELNVPILALSQLSREIEKRTSPVPVLSDLRESGAIEQDADLVCFLHKPTEGQIAEDNSIKDVFYLEIAKHRNGSLAKFFGEFTGVDQSHSFIKLIDGNFNAIENWTPVDRVQHGSDSDVYEKNTW